MFCTGHLSRTRDMGGLQIMKSFMCKEEYLQLLTGKTGKFSSREFKSAILLNYFIFKQCEGYSGKDVKFFEMYLKNETYGKTKRSEWKRLTYREISKGLMGFINNNKYINEAIEPLIKKGYIDRYQKGCNTNKKGQIKSDVAYWYRVNLKKLLTDLKNNGLLDKKAYLKCSKVKYNFEKLLQEKLNKDWYENQTEEAQIKNTAITPQQSKTEEHKVKQLVTLDDYLARHKDKADEFYKHIRETIGTIQKYADIDEDELFAEIYSIAVNRFGVVIKQGFAEKLAFEESKKITTFQKICERKLKSINTEYIYQKDREIKRIEHAEKVRDNIIGTTPENTYDNIVKHSYFRLGKLDNFVGDKMHELLKDYKHEKYSKISDKMVNATEAYAHKLAINTPAENLKTISTLLPAFIERVFPRIVAEYEQ
jgi:hypothetical protein